MSIQPINSAICELFGVDPKTCTALNIKVRAGRYPIVMVKSIVRNIGCPVKEEWSKYKMVKRA